MLGNALKIIRTFHDLKQREAAEKLGISISYLSEIENERKSPSIELIKKYSKVFGIPPSAILFFSEELDAEKKRSNVKIALRNGMFNLMKIVENARENSLQN